MKYEDLYPNVLYMEEVTNFLVKGREVKPCWNCGEPTTFVELNFLAHVCSEECLNAKWNEYERAIKVSMGGVINGLEEEIK